MMFLEAGGYWINMDHVSYVEDDTTRTTPLLAVVFVPHSGRAMLRLDGAARLTVLAWLAQNHAPAMQGRATPGAHAWGLDDGGAP